MPLRSVKFNLIFAGVLAIGLFLFTTPLAVFADDGNPPLDPSQTQPVLSEEVIPTPAESDPSLVDQQARPVVEEAATADSLEILPIQDETNDPLAEVPENDSGSVVENTPTESTGPASDDISQQEQSITVVNEIGESIPLTSQSIAETISDSDPWFTVGTTTYNFTTADCDPGVGVTPCANPIQAAINYMASNTLTPTDRKLHVETGTFNGVVVVDGTLPGVNGLLTLEGAGSVFTILNGQIEVRNMPTGFTISGFTINSTAGTGAVYLHDNSGAVKVIDVKIRNTGGSGISISNQNGTVELNRINVRSTPGVGAYVNNTLGVAGVTIRNSSFDDNQIDGVQVYSKGSVNILSSSASQNLYAGFFLSVSNSIIIRDGFAYQNGNGIPSNTDYGYQIAQFKGSLLIDNSKGLQNTERGLYAVGDGNVTITNSSFNDNYRDGALIEVCLVTGSVCTTVNPGNITISNSEFNNNGLAGSYPGLELHGKGAISLSGVSVIGNSDIGIKANIQYTLSPLTAINTTTNGNGDTGFRIVSKGPVSITNLESSFNGYNGIDINNNTGSASVSILASPGVINLFGLNGNSGVNIISAGQVTLTNIQAQSSGGYGILVDNTSGIGGISLLSNGVRNEIVNSASNGVQFMTHGAVTVNSLFSDLNNGSGLTINANGAAKPSVTVNNSILNRSTGYGLYVLSNGLIKVNNTSANANTSDGMSLDNTAGTADVQIISIPGLWEVSGNAGYGLRIVSQGAVNVSNLSALSNGSDGINILNTVVSFPKGITLVNITSMYNGSNGLVAVSSGLISAKGMTTNQNTVKGSFLVNNSGSAGISVLNNGSINNSFSSNGGDGLFILTNGVITMANINASSNGGEGARVNNVTGTNSITLNAVGTFKNTFDGNALNGLYLSTSRAVTLTMDSASYNGGRGLYSQQIGTGYSFYLNSNSYNKPKFNYNGSIGADISSQGKVSLKDITANGNGYNGTSIVNSPFPYDVYVLNGVFNENGLVSTSNGVYIGSDGNIFWTNGSANGNSGGGGNIYNSSVPSGSKNITITNVAFNNNQNGSGLGAYSKGKVTLNNVTAAGNSQNNFNVPLNTHIQDNVTPEAPEKIKLSLTAGTTVVLYAGSTDFDAYLSLYNPSSSFVASDNNSGGGTNARITYVVPTTGVYTLYVEDSGSYAIGSYDFYYILSGGAIPSVTSPTISGLTVVTSGPLASVVVNNNSRKDFGNNASNGLNLITEGSISVKGVLAVNNGLDGLSIYNTLGTGTNPISISDASVIGSANGNGIVVNSKGGVTMANINSADNRYFGVYVAETNPAVTTFTDMLLNDNQDDGLYVIVNGKVTLQGVSAQNNSGIGSNGVSIYNGIGGADIVILAPVGSSQPNSFTGNGARGIELTSNGNIIINKAEASDNGSIGIYLYSGPGKAMTVSNTIANGNSSYGIMLSGTGAFSLNTVEASYNSLEGIYLDGTSAIDSSKSTSLSKVKTNNNGGYGLNLTVKGNITLNAMSANNNSNSGMLINNLLGTGTITVLNSLGNSTATNNNGSGMDLYSTNVVYVTGLITKNNSTYGLSVTNTNLNNFGVSLNSVTSSENEMDGINISTSGNVNANKIVSIQNGIGLNYSGMVVSAIGYDIKVSNSRVTGNGRYGIQALTGIGKTLYLNNTMYYGNDRFLGSIDPDIVYTGNVSIS